MFYIYLPPIFFHFQSFSKLSLVYRLNICLIKIIITLLKVSPVCVCSVQALWPDLKQPLSLNRPETEMENGVRSNQHRCHDYVHSTPTCNQATGRAATKPMWQLQVDWKCKGWTETRGWVCEEGKVGEWPHFFPPARFSLCVSVCRHLHTGQENAFLYV